MNLRYPPNLRRFPAPLTASSDDLAVILQALGRAIDPGDQEKAAFFARSAAHWVERGRQNG